MLAEIEEAVKERIREKIIEPARIEVEKAHGALKTLSLPAIDVICGGGPFEKLAQKYQLNTSVFVVVTFQNYRNTQELRRGVFKILEAVVGCLQLQKLGLPIDKLKPKRIDDVSTKEDEDDKKAVIQIEFETGFIIHEMQEEEIDDLLKIGLKYYLQPDHPTSGDRIDAVDVVVLREGGTQ